MKTPNRRERRHPPTLRELRAAAGLTQRQLADAIELPLNRLRYYECANSAPLYIRLAIGTFLAILTAERSELADPDQH